MFWHDNVTKEKKITLAVLAIELPENNIALAER